MVLILAVFTQQAYAQIGTGNLFIDGGFGISSSESFNNSSSYLRPSAHYFISDNLSFGGSFSLNTSRNNPGQDAYNRTNNLAIVPALRYYKGLGENMFFYGEGSLGLGFGGTTAINGNDRTDINSTIDVVFGISPGIIYTPNEKIGFDFNFSLVSFTRNSSTDETDTPTTTTVTNNFQFGFDSFTPTFGVYYIIGN